MQVASIFCHFIEICSMKILFSLRDKKAYVGISQIHPFRSCALATKFIIYAAHLYSVHKCVLHVNTHSRNQQQLCACVCAFFALCASICPLGVFGFYQQKGGKMISCLVKVEICCLKLFYNQNLIKTKCFSAIKL